MSKVDIALWKFDSFLGSQSLIRNYEKWRAIFEEKILKYNGLNEIEKLKDDQLAETKKFFKDFPVGLVDGNDEERILTGLKNEYEKLLKFRIQYNNIREDRKKKIDEAIKVKADIDAILGIITDNQIQDQANFVKLHEKLENHGSTILGFKSKLIELSEITKRLETIDQFVMDFIKDYEEFCNQTRKKVKENVEPFQKQVSKVLDEFEFVKEFDMESEEDEDLVDA